MCRQKHHAWVPSSFYYYASSSMLRLTPLLTMLPPVLTYATSTPDAWPMHVTVGILCGCLWGNRMLCYPLTSVHSPEGRERERSHTYAATGTHPIEAVEKVGRHLNPPPSQGGGVPIVPASGPPRLVGSSAGIAVTPAHLTLAPQGLWLSHYALCFTLAALPECTLLDPGCAAIVP